MDSIDRFDRSAAGGRLVVIEALRGLAALAIVVLHALGASAVLGMADGRGLAPLEAGVDVFFVISGFVMVRASWTRFGAAGAARRFAAHRVARIVPLYWAVTTVFAAIAWVRPAAFTGALDGWPSLLASYLFVPWQREDGSMLPVFRLGWTLQYEALFYALFAAFLWLRRGPALACIAAGLSGLIALGLAWPGAPPAVAFWTDPIIAEFGFGMALAVAHDRGLRLPPRAAPVLAAVAFALLLLPMPAMSLPRPLALGVPAALLVALVLLPERPLLGARARRAALWLGAISYALYLTHLFAVRAMREAFGFGGFSPGLFVPAAILASLAFAAAAHAAERPAVATMRRWLG